MNVKWKFGGEVRNTDVASFSTGNCTYQ